MESSVSEKPAFEPVTKITVGESFTIADEHKGGVILSHSTATIYPNCSPVYEVAFAAILNQQVRQRPALLAVLGVGKQVWPPTVTTQNVDVNGSTADIPCGYGQCAAAKAVADLVAEGIITEEIGNSIAGIVVQQFHHWALTHEDVEHVLREQYHGARNAILKALGGGGSYKDTIANVDHVHELVSNAAFGAIAPERVKEILHTKGAAKFLPSKAAPAAAPAGPTALESKQLELLDLNIAAAKRANRPWILNWFS